MGGRAITPERAINVAFSDGYTFHTAGFVLLDKRREEFSELETIKKMKQLNLGIGDNPYYVKMVGNLFPHATLTLIENPRQYFKGNYKDVDAMVFSAEAGSAWAMLYPEYSSIIPEGLTLKAPVGLTLPKGQQDYVQFILL